MAWWTGSATGLDFETDSPDPNDARIITAAMVQINGGDEPVALEVMAKPERPIPEGASAIHGISTERAEAEGIEREEAVRIVVDQLMLAGPDRPVVGHNLSYDLTVLDRELRRTGVGHLLVDRAAGGQVIVVADGQTAAVFPAIDTFVLDKAVDRFRKGSRKLEATAIHYGVPMAEGSAHGATADVFAALRIAFRIQRRAAAAADYVAENGGDPMVFRTHPFMRHYAGRRDPLELVKTFASVNALTLAELHAAQVGWAADQAEGLREHFMRNPDKGDPASVDGSWPLRTLTDDASTVETISTTLI